MDSDKVIDLERPKSSLLDAIGRTPRSQANPAIDPVSEPTPDPSMLALEEMSPLPQASDAYEPHSRMVSRPLATIFFLGKAQLPDGFAYSGFERARLIPGERPGGGPSLVIRFNGSVIYEVLIEGQNLLWLCSAIGRHVIQWVREHPSGRADIDDKAVFIRRINVREIERA